MSAARNRRSITAQQLAMLNTQGLCSLRKSALLFGTALSVAAGFGYGRGAYAQEVLSGTQTSTQTLEGPGEFVTDNTFSVDTSEGSGNAITITTASVVTGETTFVDNYASAISGQLNGVNIENKGSGALSITTTGVVSTEGGGNAIRAIHEGSGTLSISAQGNVANAANFATIYADAASSGAGDIAITVSGAVTNEDTGSESAGIYAQTLDTSNNSSSPESDISITLGQDASVSSGILGIGALSAGGSISIAGAGSTVSRYGYGVVAHNANRSSTKGIDITVSDVTASRYGIVVGDTQNDNGNQSDGAVNIIADGDVEAGVGIYANNDGSGALSITTNGDVTGGTGDGIYANNASTENLTITINEGGSVSTSGTDVANDFAIEASGGGAVIVNNAGTITGRVNLSNSNTFTNSGTWDLAGTTSDFNATGDSTVENAGLIIAAKDSASNETSAIDNLDTFRNNAGGIIRLADGAAGDVFRIDADAAGNDGAGAGNFVANGGTIELDVVLGGDGSAADLVDISGSVTLGGAPTALSINSVGGGTGGETTTGIEVVSVGGTSDAGAFTLASPVEVGAFAYELSLGECADGSTENWYLCYTDQPGTTAAVFEAMPTMLLNAFVRTETLQQRLGARVSGNEADGVDQMLANATGFWMRAWGDYADITPDQSSSEAEWSADIWGLQTGIGQSLGRYAGGELVGGANIRYTASQNDLSTPFSSGRVDAEGHGVGLSMTWFDDSGLYADTNAGVDWVRTDARSAGGGTLLENYDDAIYSVSAEVGQRIVLDSGMTLVPQAQINWGQIDDSSLEDALGNAVVFEDRSRVTARLGLSVEKQVTDTQWGSGKVYGFGNVLHDLSGDQTVSYDGVELTQSSSGTWGEVGGGFSLTANGTIDFYGQLAVRQALDDVEGEAASFSAGVRFRF